jgi:small subunit ribosomal protein S7
MSRRKAAPKREILPDPLFKSDLIAKFTNAIMRDGKKSKAEQIVYGALDSALAKFKTIQKQKTKSDKGDDAEGDSATSFVKPFTGTIRDSDTARDAAISLFRKALENITPSVEVKSRRVGGSTYQVPVEIRVTRRRALAMRWLSDFASKRGEKTMVSRLASEILEAIEGRGGAVKKREDVHRMAKANQAYAHYRW